MGTWEPWELHQIFVTRTALSYPPCWWWSSLTGTLHILLDSGGPPSQGPTSIPAMLLQPEKKSQISRPNEVRSSRQQGEGHENAIPSTSQTNLSDFFFPERFKSHETCWFCLFTFCCCCCCFWYEVSWKIEMLLLITSLSSGFFLGFLFVL